MFEAAIQQQPGFFFCVAYKGMQSMLAKRAHAMDMRSVYVSDNKPGCLTAVQDYGPRAGSTTYQLASAQCRYYFSGIPQWEINELRRVPKSLSVTVVMSDGCFCL